MRIETPALRDRDDTQRTTPFSTPISQNPLLRDNLLRNTSEKIIFDPTQTSINTIVDSKKFQYAWGSFSECYLLVAEAPEGTQAAVFDVDAVFRNIPTHASAHPFLAIMLRGRIFDQNVIRSHREISTPPILRNKILVTQDAAVNKSSTQKKDASRLREFLSFCAGLGIRPNNAIPASEDILLLG